MVDEIILKCKRSTLTELHLDNTRLSPFGEWIPLTERVFFPNPLFFPKKTPHSSANKKYLRRPSPIRQSTKAKQEHVTPPRIGVYMVATTTPTQPQVMAKTHRTHIENTNCTYSKRRLNQSAIRASDKRISQAERERSGFGKCCDKPSIYIGSVAIVAYVLTWSRLAGQGNSSPTGTPIGLLRVKRQRMALDSMGY